MKKRIIARIDVKNEFAIKGIHLEGLRKVGDPNELAHKYYNEGIDEIIFMDAVAAYYDRNSLTHLIKDATEDIFVPITVGGGIRTIENIKEALNAGADKVAINTQAVKTPEFISTVVEIFGSQCIVASIEAKMNQNKEYEVYVDNGREPTGIKVKDWVKQLQNLGVGEIMLTSIDKEGTKKGFDDNLVRQIESLVTVPLIICGGAGNDKHIHDIFQTKQVDAIAIASVLHYKLVDLQTLKLDLVEKNVEIRA